MQYAISQLVLDVLGDLLSKHQCYSRTTTCIDRDCSPLHPASADLASEAESASKVHIGMFAMLNRGCDHLHSDSSERPRVAR